MKIIKNPQINDNVLVASVVLNPWNKIAEATMVAVVKKT